MARKTVLLTLLALGLAGCAQTAPGYYGGPAYGGGWGGPRYGYVAPAPRPWYGGGGGWGWNRPAYGGWGGPSYAYRDPGFRGPPPVAVPRGDFRPAPSYAAPQSRPLSRVERQALQNLPR